MTMWQGSEEISLEAQTILKDMVEKFYAHLNHNKKIPSFESFFQFIDDYAADHADSSWERFFDFESLRLVLENYATGEYRHLLSSTDPVDLSERPFIVFDIESLESDKFVFPVVGLIIMELIMEKVRKLRGRRKRFVIDEGWKVLRGELHDFVEYLYRTFRKHEGSILLATQDIRDIGLLEVAGGILSNSDTVVLMPRGTRKNFEDLQRWLSLTDHEIDLVRDLKKGDRAAYREFFIKQGDHARIFRHEVSPKTQAVYSSKGKEKEEIQRYFQKYGNLQLAINQFIENKTVKLKTTDNE